MKKIFFQILVAASLLMVAPQAYADTPSAGTEVDVTTGEWDDEENPNITVEFEDSAVASIGTQQALRTVIEEGCVVVYSPKQMSLPVYDIKGRLVTQLSLLEGRNKVEDLAKGIYIIGHTKVNHL